MPVNKGRRNGSYVPLSAHYYKDDAIADAGERAELLYVRGLAFCADVLSDGFISDTQLSRFVGVGMRDAKKRAQALVDNGLWIREDKGYRVAAWLKWNKSNAEIRADASKDAGRKAEERKGKGGQDDHDESESERSPNGHQAESDTDVQTDSDESPASRARSISSSTSTSSSSRGARDTSRSTTAPDHMLITSDMREWAKSRDIHIDLDSETETFLNHHRAKGTKFKDWRAAWRTWMNNTKKWGGAPAKPTGTDAPFGRISEQ